jgi:DNA ligase (NAD+)
MNTKKLLRASVVDRKAAYLAAKEAYYNEGNSPLTDAQFDALEESLKRDVPKWVPLKATGVKPKLGFLGKKSEVKLSSPCPSLDKLIADKPVGVDRWIKKATASYGSYFRISEKIDGSSVLATYTKVGNRLKLTELATRGDGVIGKSILFLAPYVKTLPLDIPAEGITRLDVRLEAVMPVSVYSKKWAGTYDSARALASAILNRHDAAPALADIHFVALMVMQPTWGISTGIDFLKRSGFLTARGSRLDASKLSTEFLVAALEDLRAKSKYECDGLVIYSENQKLTHTAARPDFAKAFKVNEDASALTTKIVKIIWKPSAFGLVVPKAVISPIKFGGVTVKQASLYNAKWALDRGVGVGATVRVLRSGDIIPKIIEVVKPAKFELPPTKGLGTYTWDKTKTNIVLLADTNNPDVLARKFSRLFGALGLEQLSIGLATKLVDAGYTSTDQVMVMTKADFSSLPGVKSMASKFEAQLKRAIAGEFDLPTMMVASGCFGRGLGRTRCRSLENAHPKLLTEAALKNPDLQGMVGKVPGCGPAFAKTYVEGLPAFWDWMNSIGAAWKKSVKPVAIQGPLSGKSFSWTGYRSKDEEDLIIRHGGSLVDFGSKTSVLFYNPLGKASTKVVKAQTKGIPTFIFKDFLKKHKLE